MEDATIIIVVINRLGRSNAKLTYIKNNKSKQETKQNTYIIIPKSLFNWFVVFRSEPKKSKVYNIFSRVRALI